jgi:hypothetical protein
LTSVRARPSYETLPEDVFAGRRTRLKCHGLLSTTAPLNHFGVIVTRRAAIPRPLEIPRMRVPSQYK